MHNDRAALVSLNSTLFQQNVAQWEGGAVCLGKSGSLRCHNCTFDRNMAANGGGFSLLLFPFMVSVFSTHTIIIFTLLSHQQSPVVRHHSRHLPRTKQQRAERRRLLPRLRQLNGVDSKHDSALRKCTALWWRLLSQGRWCYSRVAIEVAWFVVFLKYRSYLIDLLPPNQALKHVQVV